MASDEWHQEDGGAVSGPHSEDEIRRRVADGRIGRRTRVWRPGMTDWEPAEEHFGFPEPPPLTRPGETGPESPAPAGLGADGLHLYPGAPARGFGEAITVCMGKYATFSGRASRSEFWFFVLFAVLLDVALAVAFPPLSAVASVALLLPKLAAAWRRLHDTGRSGWYAGGFLLAQAAAVTVFGILWSIAESGSGESGKDVVQALSGVYGIGVVAYVIAMALFLAQKGEPGPNRYG